MASPPRPRASPPALPDELVEEILLRLPPDDPACIIRASVVCKTWSSIISHRSFRRRLHDLHRTPPVLGFLHNWRDRRIPNFIPTTASAFSLAAPDRRFWRALDCRHGRALFLSNGKDTQEEEEELLPITGSQRHTDTQDELLLWEPITGAQQHIPVPAAFRSDCPSAAVFCAVDGCDHRHCLGGPFYVVFVFCVIFQQYDNGEEDYITSACVYSSETGTWGELTSMQCDLEMDFRQNSNVLVGGSLFYFLSDSARILEYDLARHGVTVFDPPNWQYYDERFNLMLAEDGGLGLSEALDPHLKLWSRTREAGDGTDARWVLSRVIKLEKSIPGDARLHATAFIYVLGFAEEANAIFVTTLAGLFMIDLQSERVMKVCDGHGICNLIPLVSFYTPFPRNKHHGLPSWNPSEEASCKERGGEEEKAVEQAQHLFGKGSNAIEEGTLSMPASSTLSRLGFQVSEEVALECAQEVDNPLDDVPQSVPTEESVTGAADKDYDGNSKTSHINVEDAAAPSRKGVSEDPAVEIHDFP